MNTDLSQQINIGKELEKKLIKAGIDNFKELKTKGSEKSFLLIRAFDNEACINMLYALEGAIQGIRWHNLSLEKKKELKLFFDMAIKK